jgi:hypothetical protein
MKIEWNNPKILEGIIEETLKRKTFKDVLKDKLEAGGKGGLIYFLFPYSGGIQSLLHRSFILESEGKRSEAIEAIDFIGHYIDKANITAKDYGFELVTKEIIGEKEIKFYEPSDSYSSIGIGKTKIDSKKTLDKFFKMIYKEKADLDSSSKYLKDLLENVTYDDDPNATLLA